MPHELAHPQSRSMTQPILSGWTEQTVADFAAVPIQLQHCLDSHPLFAEEALIRLLETMDRGDYQVNTMDVTTHDHASRREGEIGALSGRQVLDAVKSGRIWILLMRPQRFDHRYNLLLQEIYGEFARQVPGFRPYLL